MKKASITDAKNNLSKLIDRVKAGSTVVIMDRGRPVARLEPVTADRAHKDDRLEGLFRDGVLRPAQTALTKEALTAPPARMKRGASGVRALIDERREGR